MWKRKELKTEAKKVVHKNYWTAIVVCFLIAILTGEFGTSIVSIWQAEDSMDPNYIIHQEEKVDPIIDTFNETQIKVFKTIEANLSSAMKPQKYIFKIWDAIASFSISKNTLGVVLIIAAVLAYAFTVFV